MSKIYTVILNSVQGSAVGDIRTVTYQFDWSQLPDKKYLVRFQFVTGLFTSTNVSALNILTDFGQLNTLFATPPGGGASSSALYRYLGTARWSGIGANTWLFADQLFNCPVMLNGRPRNNIFQVTLTNNDATNSLYSSTTLPNAYMLTLSFEEID